MTQDGILKGVLITCTLALLVCGYALSLLIDARTHWWMVAGSVLALSNGCLQTYTTYRQLRSKQIGDSRVVKRVTSLLGGGTLLLVFVPLFGPRVWAFLRQ